jgi:NAD(P)-dependent dehydrogenase (short-subunit alcohol dehydrogenase family)
MTVSLTGRTALITGAGRGIGRAIAVGLARAGADVLLVARSAAELGETVSLIAAEGAPDAGQARAVAGDIADDRQRQELAQAALAGGRVDVLVNNAAIVEPLGASPAISAAAVRRAFDVNVIAPAALSAAVLPGMIGAGRGRIVNVSSGIVDHPGSMAGGNAYAATKAALEAHTRSLAGELAGTGVTANIYRPGGVDTAMQEWIRGQGSAAHRPSAAGAIPPLLCRWRSYHRRGVCDRPARSPARPGRPAERRDLGRRRHRASRPVVTRVPASVLRAAGARQRRS